MLLISLHTLNRTVIYYYSCKCLHIGLFGLLFSGHIRILYFSYKMVAIFIIVTTFALLPCIKRASALYITQSNIALYNDHGKYQIFHSRTPSWNDMLSAYISLLPSIPVHPLRRPTARLSIPLPCCTRITFA